ncbi:MAG: asparagine synthase B [Caldilineaceae bacterium]
MCGVLGAFGGAAAADLASHLAQLRHRGPDGSGICETAAGVLAHTRLAIVDVEHGGQPQAYGPLHISYNGEIYNHLALRREYLGQETLATNSDTEVVLRLYATLGPTSVELLDGMFAIAILDDDALFLARDPIGIKPLYLGFAGSALYFASEIKALPAEVERVEVFPPGHWYHSQMGLHRFYHVGQARSLLPAPRDETAAQEQLRTILRDAVVKRLMADVPVGVSLSGGLDSSIVTLLAKEGLLAKGQDVLHSFAVGVEGGEDLAAARSVAVFLGTQHHERVYSMDEMLAILPEVLYSLESCDPALVRSALPNYFLAELAAAEVKVMLTGEGADELYAGYDYLRGFAQAEQLQQEMEYIVGALHNTNLQRADRMSMRFGLEARVPFLDVNSIAYALALPAAWKMTRTGADGQRVEKALLRSAFAGRLPDAIVRRPKQKFSAGAGSSQLLARHAEEAVSDRDFLAESDRLCDEWGYTLPNKEGLLYYRILAEAYPDDRIFATMGVSRSL